MDIWAHGHGMNTQLILQPHHTQTCVWIHADKLQKLSFLYWYLEQGTQLWRVKNMKG